MSPVASFHIPAAVLPAGSIVVVTGASGSMGSYICDQLLGLGYHVRGITRNGQRSAWLDRLFLSRYGAGKFELVEIPDFSVEGAFKGAIEGKRPTAFTARKQLTFLDFRGTWSDSYGRRY